MTKTIRVLVTEEQTEQRTIEVELPDNVDANDIGAVWAYALEAYCADDFREVEGMSKLNVHERTVEVLCEEKRS